MFTTTAFCFNVDVFISKIGMNISCSNTSISFCRIYYIQQVDPNDLVSSYLEFGSHPGDDFPEDLYADLEDLRYWADRVSAQA